MMRLPCMMTYLDSQRVHRNSWIYRLQHQTQLPLRWRARSGRERSGHCCRRVARDTDNDRDMGRNYFLSHASQSDALIHARSFVCFGYNSGLALTRLRRLERTWRRSALSLPTHRYSYFTVGRSCPVRGHRRHGPFAVGLYKLRYRSTCVPHPIDHYPYQIDPKCGRSCCRFLRYSHSHTAFLFADMKRQNLSVSLALDLPAFQQQVGSKTRASKP